LPKVSVILTSYNHAKYLRESISSVLDQTFSDFELIIGDDASTDESWNIIKSYDDPRIHAFKHEYNEMGGIIQEVLLNKSASGEYIAIHHSDDIWEAQKLEKQVAFLDSHPEIGAVFTNATPIGELGELFVDKTHIYFHVFDQPNRSRYEWLNFFFNHGNALCHPSVLIRKVCYEKCGSYRYGLLQLGDLDMWVRLCMEYEIYVMPERLVRFRIRDNMANASGGLIENHIRHHNDFFHVLDNYRRISSYEELVRIFPSARKYYRPGGSDVLFILGMIALESERFRSIELFGLDLLFEALNDPSRARKVKELYGFDVGKFMRLSGSHDIFGIGRQMVPNERQVEPSAGRKLIHTVTETVGNGQAAPLHLDQLGEKQIIKNHDTCVILHLYYPNMWNDILSYLSNLDKKFDLFVTIPYDVDISEDIIREGFPQAYIYRCENRGRDIAPFLAVFSVVSKLGYTYMCKIHTKKSLHIGSGDQWQHDMLDKLLGSHEIISRIKRSLDEHSDWGLIAPKGHVAPNNYFWRQNEQNVVKLANSFNIPMTGDTRFSFVAGTMFWFRTEALSMLTDTNQLQLGFEPELGQQDGTLAHAYERFFGMLSNYAGYKIAESDSEKVEVADISYHFQLLAQTREIQEESIHSLAAQLSETKHTVRIKEKREKHLVRTIQSEITERRYVLEWQLSQRVKRKHVGVLIDMFEFIKYKALRFLFFVKTGNKSLLGPTPEIFLGTWYLFQNIDIKGAEPYLHFLVYGWKEQRAPNPFFDTAYYLEHNPDVITSGSDPLTHYLTRGWKAGSNPGPFFDVSWYISNNPDVAREKMEPLQHYLQYGIREKKKPCKDFSFKELFNYYPRLKKDGWSIDLFIQNLYISELEENITVGSLQ
jgi:glycosyltransferase involved in cell wall biosynthesis